MPGLLAATNGTALWYLTRASGVVALVLLTGTVVLGVVASVGWTTERWPRFLSQTVHRNLSLLCLGVIGVHIVTTVSDGFVPISLADAIVPFRSPYRPFWVGLGAASFDLLLAVLVTSALRHRIGYRSWRFVHWLAYVSWPVAVLHGLGTGSDATIAPVLAVDVLCTVAVVCAVAWRLFGGPPVGSARRLLATGTALVVTVVIGTVAALGPLRPGWSHRSGTSSALLAQIAAKFSGATAAPSAAPTTTSPSSGPSSNSASGGASAPQAPFSLAVAGTQSTTSDGSGTSRITLALHLADAASTPLTIELTGVAVPGGGVSLTEGSVSLGSLRGPVTSLDGDTVAATLSGSGSLALTVTLNVDQATGAISGTAVGTTGA